MCVVLALSRSISPTVSPSRQIEQRWEGDNITYACGELDDLRYRGYGDGYHPPSGRRARARPSGSLWACPRGHRSSSSHVLARQLRRPPSRFATNLCDAPPGDPMRRSPRISAVGAAGSDRVVLERNLPGISTALSLESLSPTSAI